MHDPDLIEARAIIEGLQLALARALERAHEAESSLSLVNCRLKRANERVDALERQLLIGPVELFADVPGLA